MPWPRAWKKLYAKPAYRKRRGDFTGTRALADRIDCTPQPRRGRFALSEVPTPASSAPVAVVATAIRSGISRVGPGNRIEPASKVTRADAAVLGIAWSKNWASRVQFHPDGNVVTSAGLAVIKSGGMRREGRSGTRRIIELFAYCSLRLRGALSFGCVMVDRTEAQNLSKKMNALW